MSYDVVKGLNDDFDKLEKIQEKWNKDETIPTDEMAWVFVLARMKLQKDAKTLQEIELMAKLNGEKYKW